jgi:PAS domain S-box-containing protein
MQDQAVPPGAPAGSSEPSETVRLADLQLELVKASTESEVLAALAAYLVRWQASALNLIYFDLDAEGAPVSGEVVAAWVRGQLSSGPLPSSRFRIGDFGISAVWQAAPHEPLLLSEIASDPRVDPMLRAASEAGGYQAVVILPLYSETFGGWQGMLTMNWQAPRPFSQEEYVLARLLMASLATHIGGRRSQEALRAALAEAELLHDVTKRLNTASSLDETLAALALPAPSQEELQVTLCTFDSSGDKVPEWMTLLAGWSPDGKFAGAPAGTRFHLPDFPFARLYMSSPGEPILISDVETDPRLDDVARSTYLRFGIRATVVMSLTLQGRWIGLFSISWGRKVALGDRQQRIYRSLSRQVALLVENRLMLDRLRGSLEETQEKSSMLRALLDHLPVGVVLLEAASGKPVLFNPAAARLQRREFGLESDADSEPALEQVRLVYPDSDRPIPMDELAGTRVLATGTTQSLEMDVVPASGKRIHLDTIAAPVRDETGGIKNVVLMISDITARKSAERERARLQEEVIRVQAATLAERSSPLIPITDDILVLPLIGSLDTDRGHQVMDTLLAGTSQSRARVAIIDITGVRTVDTQAASALTNAAQALRLLGVEPILTGIRPEVAQTLIGLGVRLDGITTRSTLQSGIQFALRRLGRKTLG